MTREIYTAPWAEPLLRPERVELVPYGPSARGHARKVAEYRDWAWRPEVGSERADADAELAAFMAEHAGDVPTRERDVFVAVVEQGHSSRWCAKLLGISRSSVQVYLRRLRKRARRWREEGEV